MAAAGPPGLKNIPQEAATSWPTRRQPQHALVESQRLLGPLLSWGVRRVFAMRTCSYCGEHVDEAVVKCPHCRGFSREILLRLLRHPAALIRRQAASHLVFLVPDEEIVRGLAEALRDPVVGVRQEAGLELFICGAKAEPATEALIAALDDSDLKVRRLAAGSLSMIGPPARAALPKLATLRNASDELLRVWVAEAEARIGMESAPN